jgi:hypothetical protein
MVRERGISVEDWSGSGATKSVEASTVAAKPMNGTNALQRPDCVAGHVRLELRNVVA